MLFVPLFGTQFAHFGDITQALASLLGTRRRLRHSSVEFHIFTKETELGVCLTVLKKAAGDERKYMWLTYATDSTRGSTKRERHFQRFLRCAWDGSHSAALFWKTSAAGKLQSGRKRFCKLFTAGKPMEGRCWRCVSHTEIKQEIYQRWWIQHEQPHTLTSQPRNVQWSVQSKRAITLTSSSLTSKYCMEDRKERRKRRIIADNVMKYNGHEETEISEEEVGCKNPKLRSCPLSCLRKKHYRDLWLALSLIEATKPRGAWGQNLTVRLSPPEVLPAGD